MFWADGSLAQSSKAQRGMPQYIGDLVLLPGKQCACHLPKASALGTVDGSALRHSITNSDIQPVGTTSGRCPQGSIFSEAQVIDLRRRRQ